jgi:hypothetical protein
MLSCLTACLASKGLLALALPFPFALPLRPAFSFASGAARHNARLIGRISSKGGSKWFSSSGHFIV